MSDELLTPLNAVIGFSRVLEQNRAGNQRAEDLELLRRVRVGGEQLLTLVTRVLEQSRSANGRFEASLQPTNVTSIAAAVADEYRCAAASKGLRLTAIIPEAKPVLIDGVRFQEVVRHLLDNAVKFTPSGVIRVTLVVDLHTRQPRRLTVADSGIGIAQDRLDRIFEPFEQEDIGASRRFRGMGLGLALARTFCHSMECGLSVASIPGRGSRFTVSFPDATATKG